MHTHTPSALRISKASHTHLLCNIREKVQAQEEVAERQKRGWEGEKKEMTRKD